MRLVISVLATAVLSSAASAQAPEGVRRRFFLEMGVGASAMTDVLPAQAATRAAFTLTGSVGVRLSPRVALQTDVVMASPRASDLLTVLAVFNDDTPYTSAPAGRDRDRGRTMVAIAPAMEVQPFAASGMRVRLGPAFLAAEAQRSPLPTSGTSAGNVVQATGWGWRAGLSAPIGGRNSRAVLSADVMRANTSAGPVILVPVGVALRLP